MNESTAAASPRYAVYFAPAPATAWWRFGAAWLGRGDTQRPAPAGIAPDAWHGMTEEPRRYDFHATLKAPFRLKHPTGLDQLRQRLQHLARELPAIPLGAMYPKRFSGFVALVPAVPPTALIDLAARCVSDLDDLRAPLLPREIQRRRPEQLDDRGRQLLLRYGYPHVLERFRFHMTLAMCSDEGIAARVSEVAAQVLAPLNLEQPLVLDRLCLFEQVEPDALFQRIADFELAARACLRQTPSTPKDSAPGEGW